MLIITVKSLRKKENNNNNKNPVLNIDRKDNLIKFTKNIIFTYYNNSKFLIYYYLKIFYSTDYLAIYPILF